MQETQLDLSKKEYGEGSHRVKLWRRLCARLLDYIILGFIAFLAKSLFNIEIEAVQYQMAVFLIWILIETVLLFTWGTTPGKWLLCMTVRDMEGKKPGMITALKRSVMAALYIIGLMIPVILIIVLVSQFKNLAGMQAAPWDERTDLTVHYDDLRGFKTTVVVLSYVALATVLVIVPQVKQGLELSKAFRQQFELSDSASSFNRKGYSLMNTGAYEQAKEEFLKGLDANPGISIKSTLFNNLSWACYCLGEYEEALRYSEEGLAIGDNDSIAYCNYANALYALGDNSEAEKAYKKAVELDQTNSYAYYGLGKFKYDNDSYEEAIIAFAKYTGLNSKDTDGWCYLGLSHLYGNKNMSTAKEYLDRAMKIAPEDVFVINSMAAYYNYTGESKKVEELYQNALVKNQNDYSLLCDVARFYQNEQKYDEAIQYADRAINANGADYEGYRIKAETFFLLGEKQQAMDTLDLMIGMNPQNANLYYIAGNLYIDEYEYRLAVKHYDKALEINPLHENACLEKIRALYFSKRYTACLKYALDAENQIDNYEISWYIGDVYSRLRDSAKALEHYQKALKMNENDTALLTSIGWEYYYSEDFINAGMYADQALQIADSDYGAKELKKSIEKRQTGIMDQVTEFIEKNYMYFKSNPSYDTLKNKLKTNQSSSIEDISKLFNTVRKEDDLFSFVLYGENYRHFLADQSTETVEHKAVSENMDYIRITNFSGSTANEFLDIVESIENTQDKYLVIDLRDNGGGDTNSGCDILDFLLPDSVVCNLIYKDGYSSPYYSDDDHILFKHIFVLTDEESASCAELVTLGLKTYLDNVTVVGRQTFGKGVGQILFEDKTNGFVIFLVNHYWNVREGNVMGKGIQPDRPVHGNSTEAYMNEVLKLIAEMQ